MLVVLGKTASGKTSIVNELETNHNYKHIITYTTRPIRDGEIQDKTYHFITEEEFLQKVDDNFFAEWKTYNTIYGDWYYGSAREDYQTETENDKNVIILTPDGYRDVIKALGYKPPSIYIYASDEIIKQRLIERGDDPKEAERRLEHDTDDFKDVELLVNMIISNDGDKSLDEVVEKIIRLEGLENW